MGWGEMWCGTVVSLKHSGRTRHSPFTCRRRMAACLQGERARENGRMPASTVWDGGVGPHLGEM